jgi:hypothetical protein
MKYLKTFNESSRKLKSRDLPVDLNDELREILVDVLSTGMKLQTFITQTVDNSREILYLMIGRYENVNADKITINRDIIDDLRRAADLIRMETGFEHSLSYYTNNDGVPKRLDINADYTNFKVDMIQLLFFSKIRSVTS